MRGSILLLAVASAIWAGAGVSTAAPTEDSAADPASRRPTTIRCEPAILSMYYAWRYPPDVGDVLLVRATADSVPDALTSLDLHGLHRDMPLPERARGLWFGQAAVVERVTPGARTSIRPGDTISIVAWSIDWANCAPGIPLRPALQLAEGRYVVPLILSPRGLDDRVVDAPRPWSPYPDGWSSATPYIRGPRAAPRDGGDVFPYYPADTRMMTAGDFFDLLVALRAHTPRTTRGAFLAWAAQNPEMRAHQPAANFAAWWLDR